MFVFTVKSKLNSKKAKVLLISVIAVLLMLVIFTCVTLFDYMPPATAYYEGYGEYSTVVQSDEQAQEFVEQFSYEVEQLYSLQEVYVPIEFNEKYTGYNELQKRQGLDLEPYKGEKCKLYIYKLADYEIDSHEAFMSVMVCRNRVIGGDISTYELGSGYYTFTGERV